MAELYNDAGLNYDNWADPAGLQLGEFWSARIQVKNTGPVDVDGAKLHKDITAVLGYIPPEFGFKEWKGLDPDTTCGPIAAGKNEYDGAAGIISEEDVARGYVEVKATVKWTDPDSGKERTAVSNVWHMPVISKTGLLMMKKAGDPPNGAYYKPGEQINWTLDVYNNSREAIKDVTITDNGIVIATFGEIAAGEGKHCAVPPTTVTDYDAQVTGYVMNPAKATGTDFRGAKHTWYSNPAKALCKDPDSPPVKVLSGEVPSAVSLPKGCRFADRCPFAKPVCFEQEPELSALPADPAHRVACHLAGQKGGSV